MRDGAICVSEASITQARDTHAANARAEAGQASTDTTEHAPSTAAAIPHDTEARKQVRTTGTDTERDDT